MKMYSYIVVYDLCKPDRDYQSLYEMCTGKERRNIQGNQ